MLLTDRSAAVPVNSRRPSLQNSSVSRWITNAVRPLRRPLMATSRSPLTSTPSIDSPPAANVSRSGSTGSASRSANPSKHHPPCGRRVANPFANDTYPPRCSCGSTSTTCASSRPSIDSVRSPIVEDHTAHMRTSKPAVSTAPPSPPSIRNARQSTAPPGVTRYPVNMTKSSENSSSHGCGARLLNRTTPRSRQRVARGSRGRSRPRSATTPPGPATSAASAAATPAHTPPSPPRSGDGVSAACSVGRDSANASTAVGCRVNVNGGVSAGKATPSSSASAPDCSTSRPCTRNVVVAPKSRTYSVPCCRVCQWPSTGRRDAREPSSARAPPAPASTTPARHSSEARPVTSPSWMRIPTTGQPSP
mmetsp:Transcript_10195/g.32242  ORF Transcript_10195/g.32242 Transcript_10195/m.32242 type:complete len:363 (-) Transcript_10195:750-1838(-)